MQSKKRSDYGKFKLTAGQFYGDAEKDKGTGPDLDRRAAAGRLLGGHHVLVSILHMQVFRQVKTLTSTPGLLGSLSHSTMRERP